MQTFQHLHKVDNLISFRHLNSSNFETHPNLILDSRYVYIISCFKLCCCFFLHFSWSFVIYFLQFFNIFIIYSPNSNETSTPKKLTGSNLIVSTCQFRFPCCNGFFDGILNFYFSFYWRGLVLIKFDCMDKPIIITLSCMSLYLFWIILRHSLTTFYAPISKPNIYRLLSFHYFLPHI